MNDNQLGPGFIAVAGDSAAITCSIAATEEVSTVASGPAHLAYWGLERMAVEPLGLCLSPVMRTADGAVGQAEVAERLHNHPAALTRLLPPFAAIAGSDSGIVAVADSMGFRQLFHTTLDATGTAAMATSALHLAGLRSSELDETSLAVQSLLGWQLGQRTLFAGIEKLAPGVVARLTSDGITLEPAAEVDNREISLPEAVLAAAALLRRSLESVLDDHPDAVLQLTGGQDSRLLLSAIPRARRRGLRAMTLGVAGGDVEVASDLAARYGLDHEVHDLTGLDDVTPAAAWDLTHAASIRLGGMSDPIAHAALTVAESSFGQGVRLSGLGGEVARGFYYFGRVRPRLVTKSEAVQLASWRLFANEAVEPGVLSEEFSAWARDTANSEVFRALSASGKDWNRASDDLYLRHRMQRWAGLTDTAVAHRRTVINPMLDFEFLSLADRLSPYDKGKSRFLAGLQMELDPELGRMPLEGRPAPVAYAEPRLLNTARQRLSTAKRLGRKAVQRLHSSNRPPAGGEVLARKVVAHWRDTPELLAPAAQLGIIRAGWLDSMLDGTIQPRPSSVAFLANVLVALEATHVHPPQPRSAATAA